LDCDINQEKLQIDLLQQTSQIISDQLKYDIAAKKYEQEKLQQELKDMADKYQELKNALEKAQNDLSVANDKAYQYKNERDAARAEVQNLQDQLQALQQTLSFDAKASPRMNYKQFSGNSDGLDKFYDYPSPKDTNYVIVNGGIYDVLPAKITQSPSKAPTNGNKGDMCCDLLPPDSRVGNADHATDKINRTSKKKVAQDSITQLHAFGKLVQDAPQENPASDISGQYIMDKFSALGSALNNMGASEDKSSSDKDKENLLSREDDIDEGIVFKICS